jgi:hypothetical protein
MYTQDLSNEKGRLPAALQLITEKFFSLRFRPALKFPAHDGGSSPGFGRVLCEANKSSAFLFRPDTGMISPCPSDPDYAHGLG